LFLEKYMIISIYPIERNRGDIVESFGKIFLTIGIVLVIIGIVFILGEKIGLGKLPGDIFIQRGNFTFFFPIISSIIISIILTLLLNLFKR
jgi:hypothetical protein